MYKEPADSHPLPPKELVAPRLFLSSERTGWHGMVMRAYDEPAEIEGWIDPLIPDISLVMLMRGSMHIESRHTSGVWNAQLLRQRDIILRPSESAVSELRWRSLSPQPMQTLHLDLQRDFVAQVAADMMLATHPVLHRRSGFQDPLIAQIGLTLFHELGQSTIHEALYLQTAAHLVVVHLLSHYVAASTDRRRAQPRLTQRQVRHVADYVTAHLDQHLSLDILAQQVGLSPFHFARCFRQSTGESPHEFVLQQRIVRAQQLLTATDMPLKLIASTCGFVDQSHLTRVFKRYSGRTPLLYRRES